MQDDDRAARAEADAVAEAAAAVSGRPDDGAERPSGPERLSRPERTSGPETCPFLRRLDGGATQLPLDRPDAANTCAAFGDPQPQSIRQQELVCLQAAHINCPRYLRGSTVFEPIAPLVMPERGIPRATIAASLILVAAVTTAITFVLARGGLSLPVTGSVVTTQLPTEAASATSTSPSGGVSGPTERPPNTQSSTPPVSASMTPEPTPLPGTTPVASAPVPTPAPTASPVPTSDRYSLLEPCPDKPDCFIYTVRSGNNLVSIANYFGVPYATVLELNPTLTEPSLIRAGDKIILPPPTR